MCLFLPLFLGGVRGEDPRLDLRGVCDRLRRRLSLESARRGLSGSLSLSFLAGDRDREWRLLRESRRLLDERRLRLGERCLLLDLR